MVSWAVVFSTLVSSIGLPEGPAPDPVAFPHFPDRVHAFVWKNWQLVPPERMAQVLGTDAENVRGIGRLMGLSGPPEVTADQWKRSYITLIRRNWHLLPYDQLLTLLDWSVEEMAYALKEDDFLFNKLGRLKPKCSPLKYSPPNEEAMKRAERIAETVRTYFPGGVGLLEHPLFDFVRELSTPPPERDQPENRENSLTPRFCYSYFALYGDPLLDTELDPYPPGYLARLAASGVDGVWLQGVLYKLFPFPWDESLSKGYKARLENLRNLVERAKEHGISVYLYLNEPRSMPLSFFEDHPDLKGVTEGDNAAICTSVPDVRRYLTEAVASICRAVPDLGGFFTITASENLTNCWSHGRGDACPRCGARPAGKVIAEVNAAIREGIHRSGTETDLIAWDWGWREDWVNDAIENLPQDISLMSVSEWSIPISRGGAESIVGEYCISTVGPGPRAIKHWKTARERGLKTLAKIQANNTWELSAVPYIPALENVARHAANLRDAGIEGIMLGWTLGGYPSPNLEAVAELGGHKDLSPEEALRRVAERRFGKDLSPFIVAGWKSYSTAFSEFPFHIGTVYKGPQQMGPANLLWEKPTGYRATTLYFPYDDLQRWRSVYPEEIYIGQMEKVAAGFESTLEKLEEIVSKKSASAENRPRFLQEELDIARVCAIHFRSVADQARFVVCRREIDEATDSRKVKKILAELKQILEKEIELARDLYAIQIRDSRIGFEASNQYYYVPVDLVEKVLNCSDLLTRWIPELEAEWK